MIDGGTFLLFMTQEFIVLSRHGFITDLRYAPRLTQITAGLGPAQEIIHAGERILGQDVFGIPTEIHRVEGDALISFGVHFLLEGGSLQEGDTGFLPLLISGRGKLVQGNIGKVCLLFGLFQNGLQVQLATGFVTHSTASSFSG